jgi:hypothetical protein
MAGAQHGMCELTRHGMAWQGYGMGAAWYVWISLYSDRSPVCHTLVLQFHCSPPTKVLPFVTISTQDPSLLGRQNLPRTITVLTTGRTTVMTCNMVCNEYHHYSTSEHKHTHKYRAGKEPTFGRAARVLHPAWGLIGKRKQNYYWTLKYKPYNIHSVYKHYD